MKKNEHVVSRRHYPLFCLLFTLICASLMALSTTGTALAATSDTVSESSEEQAKPAISVQLISLQKQLDKLKQSVSVSTSDNELNALNETAIALVKDVDILLAELKPKREQLQTQLDVLGPPPATSTLTETPIVAQQRRVLNTRKTQLEGQHDQVQAIKANAENLETQIIALR